MKRLEFLQNDSYLRKLSLGAYFLSGRRKFKHFTSMRDSIILYCINGERIETKK